MATEAEKESARREAWMRLRVRQVLEQAALIARASDTRMVHSEFVEEAGKAFLAMVHDLEMVTLAKLREREEAACDACEREVEPAAHPVGTGGGR